MGEVPLAHQVVRLDTLFDVGAVDTDGNSHEHVLRSLGDSSVDSKQVRSLEGFETEAT